VREELVKIWSDTHKTRQDTKHWGGVRGKQIGMARNDLDQEKYTRGGKTTPRYLGSKTIDRENGLDSLVGENCRRWNPDMRCREKIILGRWSVRKKKIIWVLEGLKRGQPGGRGFKINTICLKADPKSGGGSRRV